MRKLVMTIFLLGVLCIVPLLLTGCDDDDTASFRLNDCRLNFSDCRMQ